LALAGIERWVDASRGGSFMRKTMKIFIYTFLSLRVVLFAGSFTVAVIGNKLDKESKAFVDIAIPSIVSDWDVMELRKRASPKFNKTADYDDMQQLFDVLRGSGGLQEYGGSMGDSRILVSLEDRIVITAVYDASAEFESGSANIQISLIKHGVQWQILSFKISPEDAEARKDIT
jgi:hypothetical protein